MSRTAIINGRRISVPDVATAEGLAKAGGIEEGRVLLHATRDGSYPVPPGHTINVQESDNFVDAPQRVKGCRAS